MKKLTMFLFAVLIAAAAYTQPSYSEIKSSQLPKKANEYIKKNLAGLQVGRAGKVVENNVTKYAVVVGKGERRSILVFDKDGNYLDRVRKLSEIRMEQPKATPAATKPPTTKANPNTDPPVRK